MKYLTNEVTLNKRIKIVLMRKLLDFWVESQLKKVAFDYMWVESPLHIKRERWGHPLGAGAPHPLGVAPLSYI